MNIFFINVYFKKVILTHTPIIFISSHSGAVFGLWVERASPATGTLAVVLWALGWGDGLLGASSSTRVIRIASPSEWSGDHTAAAAET